MGFLPNVYKVFANSPAALRAFLQAQEQLSEGELTEAEREIVALAVSQVSDSEYCLAAHTVFANQAGLSDDAIRASRKGEGSGIASFASKLALQRGRLSDADLVEAREAGLSDSRMVETVAVVAHIIFTNYLNNVAHTDVDFAPVEG